MTSTAATHPIPDYSRPAARGGWVTQTLALFVDAYRELNHKKLFWVTVAVSALVVAVLGLIGYDDQGFSIAWWSIKSKWLNTTLIDKGELYRNLFIKLGIYWWLTWIGIFLALTSTAGMFPDFISAGAIDIYLAKPIGRTRLFFTKYLAGLLFVALQALIFCTASFFVIGLRGKVWEPAVFIPVPMVVLFFSFLYCVCVLMGVLTRSTIAALLLTILFWFGMLGVHVGEVLLFQLDLSEKIEAADLDRQIAAARQTIADASAATTAPTTGTSASFQASRRSVAEASLKKLEEQRREVHPGTLTKWHDLAYAVKWPLPKTSETYLLMERMVAVRMHVPKEVLDETHEDEETGKGFFHNKSLQMRTAIETERMVRQRSATWVVGTSVGFEVVVLGLAAWIFSRRDY